MRFDTRVVHAGQETDGTGAVVPPVHVATTYDQRFQDPPRYFYSRGENPTREGLERALASLEDAPFATAYSSGQAAGDAVLSLLPPGGRLVASDDVYGGTRALFALLSRRGITVEHADLTDPGELGAALAPGADMVWIEAPTNPLLKIADLADVCPRARAAGAVVVVDNTLASPALQQPLRLGADVSLYSTTKSIAGHSDVLGGALVCRDEGVHQRLLAYRTAVGSVPGALDCYLVHRGLKTLSLRVARQVDNARAVAGALEDAGLTGAVHYPGLPGHRQYGVARRQMAGPGSVLSFEFTGDPDKLFRRLRLYSCAVSLGGVRSLIQCPARSTHAGLPRDLRLRLGITDGLVRLSAGIEDGADLVEDLLTALDATG
ncbi:MULTISPECIES: PLP-dependent aspartate aminotransferase family protein [unclassified Nocardiopsis]|uniref:trans-sulfuration enzyme family protein n=1 Tax=unclassified Nocardiopsis TaxID=2649073 RepID=UPI001356814D|nr:MULTISPECIES: aminotransferase class I/II-fold pyridoxal phosphate-dependent enzyme [unclassified Nocardiopsis]